MLKISLYKTLYWCLSFSNISFRLRDIQAFQIYKLARWWRINPAKFWSNIKKDIDVLIHPHDRIQNIYHALNIYYLCGHAITRASPNCQILQWCNIVSWVTVCQLQKIQIENHQSQPIGMTFWTARCIVSSHDQSMLRFCRLSFAVSSCFWLVARQWTFQKFLWCSS